MINQDNSNSDEALFISQLQGIGVPRDAAEEAAKPQYGLVQHGRDAFRRIESNPSLVPLLPNKADLEIKKKLYSSVVEPTTIAMEQGLLHPLRGNQLLNSATSSPSPQDQDSAYTTLRSLVGRASSGPGAAQNAQRAAMQAEDALRILNGAKKDILDPLSKHTFSTGHITVDETPVFVGNQPHYRVAFEHKDTGRVWDTLVTAVKTGEYVDENGKVQDRRQLYAGGKPMLPTMGLVTNENGTIERSFGYTGYHQTDRGVTPNVFHPTTEDVQPGNLAFQRTAAWNILASGGDPYHKVITDQRGNGRLIARNNQDKLDDRMGYVSKKKSAEDAVVARNFGDYYPPAANSTQNRFALHTRIAVDEKIGINKDTKTEHSQVPYGYDLASIRLKINNGELDEKGVDYEARSWLNKKNPVTGELYDYVASPGLVLQSSHTSRNNSYGAPKPISDQGGIDYEVNEYGQVVRVSGMKGAKKGDFQKGVKSAQLSGRPTQTFYNRDTGDEVPLVSGSAITTGYGNQSIEGHLLNAAIINYGSLESDGGALIERSLGIQRETIFKTAKGFEDAELQRLNQLSGKWLPSGRDTTINPGTDDARNFGSGFGQTLIQSVGYMEGTGAIQLLQRDTPFATDISGTKAFAVYSDRPKEYGANIVYNKINDTQQFMFNALNSLAAANPEEYQTLMQAQFNPELRRNYLGGNDQLHPDTMLADVRRAKGGKYNFDQALNQDWSERTRWTSDKHELFRAAFEDLYARHTTVEDHEQNVSNDFLPFIAPPQFLSKHQQELQSEYFGEKPLPSLVTNVQPVNDVVSRVRVRQSVTRLPWITRPEAHIPGGQGTMSAENMLGVTRMVSDNPEVINRLNQFGAEKAMRKQSVLFTAALNEGATLNNTPEFISASSIAAEDAQAYKDAISKIDAGDPRSLEKKLILYQQIILKGQDKATLLHVATKDGDKGYFMPTPSALMPMVKGTDDEYAGREVKSIVTALHEQAMSVANQQALGTNGAIDSKTGRLAATNLSHLAARESTRDNFLGRSSSAGAYLSVGGDVNMPAAVTGMANDRYEDYIYRNLRETGHDVSRKQVRQLIRQAEKEFMTSVKSNGIRQSLDSGILPVAPEYRSPNMTLDQPTYASLMSERLARKLKLTTSEFQNGQIISSLPDQMKQRGDFDKDDLTIGAGMFTIQDDRLVSIVKPTSGEDIIAAAMNPEDPAKQGETWGEIHATDFGDMTTEELSAALAAKQEAEISGFDAFSMGSAITTLSKKNMGVMFNLTLGMRAWWREIGQGSSNDIPLQSEEKIRAFEYQTVLDTNPTDISGRSLAKLKNQKYNVKRDINSDLISAFLSTDPKKRRVSSSDVARMLVPIDTKNFGVTVNKVAQIIDKHWNPSGTSLEDATKEINQYLSRKKTSVGYGKSFASFFTGNQLLNSYLAYAEKNGEAADPTFFFGQFGSNADHYQELAEKAAKIKMSVGSGALFGSGNMSAASVVKALEQNSQFFPGAEAGNQMLQQTASVLGIQGASTSAMSQLANQGPDNIPGVPFDSGASGGGGGDEPPINFDNLVPPDPEEDYGGTPMDSVTRNSLGPPMPPGGIPPMPPNSGPALPPSGIFGKPPKSPVSGRYHLRASGLMPRSILGQLTGADALADKSQQALYGQVLSRVPFDSAKGKWMAGSKTPGLSDKILDTVLGLKNSTDLASQSRRQSLMYDASGNFTGGMEWKSQKGGSLWVNGHAAFVNDDAVWNMSFAKADVTPDEAKERRMQMFSYMQATGTRKANMAFFDTEAFLAAMPGVDHSIFQDEEKFAEWVNDPTQKEARQNQVAKAYLAAHNALDPDKKFASLDLTDNNDWQSAKSEFDSQMETNKPIVDTFANAQREAYGTSFYTTETGTVMDGTEGNPKIELLSKLNSGSSVSQINNSLALQAAQPGADVAAQALGLPNAATLAQGLNNPQVRNATLHPAALAAIQSKQNGGVVPPTPPSGSGGSGTLPSGPPPTVPGTTPSPMGSKYNPVYARLDNLPSMQKMRKALGGLAGQDLGSAAPLGDYLGAIANNNIQLQNISAGELDKKSAERIIRSRNYVDAIQNSYYSAQGILADANAGVDVDAKTVGRAQSIKDKFDPLFSHGKLDAQGNPMPQTAFESIQQTLTPGLVGRAQGAIEAAKNAPPAPKGSMSSSVIQGADFSSQLAGLGSVNKDLGGIIKQLGSLGNVAQTATAHAEKLTSTQENWILRTGKATDDMMKTLQQASSLAQAGDPTAQKYMSAAVQAGAWKNGTISGTLASNANLLFGRENAQGERQGGLYNVARAGKAALEEPSSELPDFRDRLAPFLMGGRSGREARAAARKEGWYGEEGSSERAAWEVGGTALGVANNAVMGYRMFRNISAELMRPLQEARGFYTQTDQAAQAALVQNGAVGLGDITSRQSNRVALGNANYDFQRSMGKSYEMAWSPLERGVSGSGTSGFLGELASIAGPSIAVGMGATYATMGNPVAGMVAGGIAATAGIYGTMSSAVSDRITRAQISKDLSTDSLGSIGKNGLLASGGVALNALGSLFSGDTKGIRDDLTTAAAINDAASGDSERARQRLLAWGNPGGLVTGGGFNADFMAAYSEQFLKSNSTALGNVSKESQTKGFGQAFAVYGMANKGNSSDILNMMKLVGAGDMAGVDTSSIASMAVGARSSMSNSQGAFEKMSSRFLPMMESGDPAKFSQGANLMNRAASGMSWIARQQSIYGKDASQAGYNLFQSGNPYFTTTDVTSSATYLTDTGITSPIDEPVRPDETGKQFHARQAATQAISNRFSRLTAAGLLGQSEALSQANAVNAGVNRNDVDAMAKVRKRAGVTLDDMLDEGLTAPQIIAKTQANISAGQANAQAMLGGSRPFKASDFAGLRPENSQGLIVQGQNIAAQGIIGLGNFGMSNSAISNAFKLNTDAGMATGYRLQGQQTQMSNRFQSYAAYGGATSGNRIALDAIATVQDPRAYAQASAILAGDPIANSMFAQRQGITTANMDKYTVQGNLPGQTAGAARGYDEQVQPVYAMQTMMRGLTRNAITSYKGSYGALDPMGYSSMNDVQRQAFGNRQQADIRNFDFGMQSRQLSRQQESITTGWKFEDQGIALNRAQQDYSYEMQGKQLDLSQREASYNYSFQSQSMGINRAHQKQEGQWGLENLAFQRDMSQVQFGFNMIDADESVRYSTGRQKRAAMRHRDEAVLTQSMNMGQMDKEEDRAKERLKWADEQFQREQRNFQMNRQFQVEGFNLSQQQHNKQKEFMQQERALQDQKIAFERKISALEMEDARKSLEIHQRFQVTMDNLKGSADQARDALREAGDKAAYLSTTGGNAAYALSAVAGQLANYPNILAQIAAAAVGPGAVQTQISSGGSNADGFGGGPFYLGGPVGPMLNFSGGGPTGGNNSRQPAGIVHGREWVVPENGALVVRGGLTDEKLDKVIAWLERIFHEGGNSMVSLSMTDGSKAVKQAVSLYQKALGA